jgi:4-hydroxy-tetrahydrodipicolinate synthase
VFEGNYDVARKINNDLYPLNSVLFCESNPIPIKAAMYIAGLLDTLEFRLPLTAPSAETMKKLEETLKNYEVIK